MTLFKNRREAGKALAEKLMQYAGEDDVIALGLPRGGVPVAFEVAMALRVPLDIVIVRKLGVPGNPELAMGAIASGGVRVMNHDVVRLLGLSQFAIDAVAAEEMQELKRREQTYRGGWPPLSVHGKTLLVIDDGMATGATMHAAVLALRKRDAARIIPCTPTASSDAVELLSAVSDDVVCVSVPDPYIAVGRWYEDFTQTTDEEVTQLLQRSSRELCGPETSGKVH